MTTGAIEIPAFDSVDAVHRSGPFRAVGHAFEVHSTSVELLGHIGHILRDLTDDGAVPENRYTLKHGRLDGEWWFELRHGNELLMRTPRVDAAIGFLLWHVNGAVALGNPDHVVIHAAAAARDGAVVAFPAVMEAGKSTLVAALVKDGWRYLSDEALLVDRRSLHAVAYPKPITLDPGSFAVHADLRPVGSHGFPGLSTEQWHVPASWIGHRPAEGGPIRALVFTRYRSAGRTELVPLSRAAAVRELAVLTFGFDGSALPTLVDLARQADCYRLSLSDLDTACRLIEHVASARP